VNYIPIRVKQHHASNGLWRKETCIFSAESPHSPHGKNQHTGQQIGREDPRGDGEYPSFGVGFLPRPDAHRVRRDDPQAPRLRRFRHGVLLSQGCFFFPCHFILHQKPRGELVPSPIQSVSSSFAPTTSIILSPAASNECSRLVTIRSRPKPRARMTS
jgi:hypothetical protein